MANIETINNGETGLTIRNKINHNFEELNNKGVLICETSSTLATQTLNTSDTKISLLSYVATDIKQVATLNEIDMRIDINKAGLYKFTGNSTIEAGTNDVLTFKLYKNGVATNAESAIISAGNGKMLTISYHGLLECSQGDYLEVFATVASGTSNLIVHKSNISIEKTIY